MAVKIGADGCCTKVLPLVLLLLACCCPAEAHGASSRKLLEYIHKGKCLVCYQGQCARRADEPLVFRNDTLWQNPPSATCTQVGCSACTPEQETYKNRKGVWITKAWCRCDDSGPPPCFPASATVKRLAAPNTWEKVALPQLRIGDTVECIVRDPIFHENGLVTSDPSTSHISHCQVYDYKKAMTNVTAHYITVSYERPGSPTPGTVTMTANHHILDAKSGKAVQAGALRPGDLLQLVSDDITTRVKVLKLTQISQVGAYVPLLTKGGLLVVDGIVAYPSSGDCRVGLDAKHWGQYFLSAPIWQTLDKSSPKFGKTLYELGIHPQEGPISAFTQKFYAVAEAAIADGRDFANWGTVAAEIAREIIETNRMYSEAEALAVYDKHLMKHE